MSPSAIGPAGVQTAPLNAVFTMSPGEEVTVGPERIRLRFVKVTEDSRCPVDVTCVWAGDASVHLEARKGTGPPAPLVLHTATAKGSTVPLPPYLLTLRALNPSPRTTRAIAADEYRVDLLLSPDRQ